MEIENKWIEELTHKSDFDKMSYIFPATALAGQIHSHLEFFFLSNFSINFENFGAYYAAF